MQRFYHKPIEKFNTYLVSSIAFRVLTKSFQKVENKQIISN